MRIWLSDINRRTCNMSEQTHMLQSKPLWSLDGILSTDAIHDHVIAGERAFRDGDNESILITSKPRSSAPIAERGLDQRCCAHPRANACLRPLTMPWLELMNDLFFKQHLGDDNHESTVSHLLVGAHASRKSRGSYGLPNRDVRRGKIV